jgi:hypothetical protein
VQINFPHFLKNPVFNIFTPASYLFWFTATLSEEISHISSQIMYNKKIADVLSEEAEHFI